ncbi:hypothetical protein HPB48_014611 [Haemaphysalis longicornis]|uniref:EF-hand domain-containing protein n=1 Tax=Haemaphysalis longicornis TaxID=44386 RepID=A0A9J6G7J2_HAELO|nr:hypothetical protein HPB48_014611 [Haemaphysalis longicornis]
MAADLKTRLIQVFDAVDADGDKKLTVDELQEAFAKLGFPPLERKTWGHFFTVYDNDHDDRINLEEFRKIHEDFTKWRAVFDGIRSQEGVVSIEQAVAALKLSDAIVSKLGRFGEAGLIKYDAFIEICLMNRAITMEWEAMATVDGQPDRRSVTLESLAVAFTKVYKIERDSTAD